MGLGFLQEAEDDLQGLSLVAVEELPELWLLPSLVPALAAMEEPRGCGCCCRLEKRGRRRRFGCGWSRCTDCPSLQYDGGVLRVGVCY